MAIYQLQTLFAGALGAAAAQGGIQSSSLASGGIQYAPADTGRIGASSPPTGAAYVVDTLTQSHPIISVTQFTLTVAGDVTATYPATTPIRVYNSTGIYGGANNNGCHTVSGSVFGGVNTVITVIAGFNTDYDAPGRLTLGVVATYHIGSPGTAMSVGAGQTTTPEAMVLTVSAVNQATPSFSVVGNFAALFAAPFDYISIIGGGNAGYYQIVSAAFASGSTAITVGSAIPSGVVAGTIQPFRLAFPDDGAGCGHDLTITIVSIV